jgi:F0F1-type ATP synthase membrane subunit b/b'
MHATTAGPGRPTPPLVGALHLAELLAHLEHPTRAWGPDAGDGGDGGDTGGDAGGKGAGDGTDDGTGTDDAGDDSGKLPDDPEEARRELARARDEAKKFRARAQAAEAKVADAERKGMTELEQAQAAATAADERATKAERALATRDLRDTVADLARAAGYRDPAKAHRHVELEELVDDDGKPDKAAISKALRDELKASPYLGGGNGGRAADAGQGRDGNGAPAGSSINDAIRTLARGKRAG